MKKLFTIPSLWVVLFAFCALPLRAQPFTATEILAHGSIADASEGGQADVDVSALKGRGLLLFPATNTAGSTPTLAMKLQQSPALAQGGSYTTTGANNIVLRNGSNDNIELAAKWTQSGDRQIKTASLMLKKVGTITSGKVLTLAIETNSTADPSNTQVGVAVNVETDDVDDEYAYVTFTFTKPVDLTDATVYWLVLGGDYDVSSSNHVTWRTATVASGGNANVYDSAWAAVATNSREFYLREYNFTDITGAAFTGLTTGSSTQTRQINVDGLSPIVRAHATVTGTSTPTYYGGITLVTSRF